MLHGSSKFTPQRAVQIVTFLNQGTTMEHAAKRAKITPQTVWNWRQAGRRAGEGPQYEFDLECTKIEAERIAFAENRLHQIIKQTQYPGLALSATKFFLAKRAPEQYGDKETLAVQLRQEMALELLDYLQERLEPAIYDIVLAALDEAGGNAPPTPKKLHS